MRLRLAVSLATMLAACGADAPDQEQPDNTKKPDNEGSNEPDGPGRASSHPASSAGDEQQDDSAPEDEPAAEPDCVTLTVANAYAGEKINAAWCFGMAYDDRFACQFYPADNVVECVSPELTYVVVFDGDAYGIVVDPSDDSELASVTQGPTGAFEIAWADGDTGVCTVVGDIATLCVTSP